MLALDVHGRQVPDLERVERRVGAQAVRLAEDRRQAVLDGDDIGFG